MRPTSQLSDCKDKEVGVFQSQPWFEGPLMVLHLCFVMLGVSTRTMPGNRSAGAAKRRVQNWRRS